MSTPEKKRLFVTRDVAADGMLVAYFTSLGYQVSGTSPLSFEALSQPKLPASDWVFFYSRNSLYFLDEENWASALHRRIAVMGPGTGEACSQRGRDADFVGSGVPAEVAADFATLLQLPRLNPPKVLFCQAETSVRSVGKALAGRVNRIEFPTYRSLPKSDWHIPDCDAILFTSPSAVRAAKGMLAQLYSSTLLSIGPTTAAALADVGFTEVELVPPKIWNSPAVRGLRS